MKETTLCAHKLLKYLGEQNYTNGEGIEKKVVIGKCIDCHSSISITENYKLIPTGKYDLYRKRD